MSYNVYWRRIMKKRFMVILVLFFMICTFSCTSSPAPTLGERFTIVLDPMFFDQGVFREGWLVYASYIRGNMEEFYRDNPDGEYIIPFDVEIRARNFMLFFYAQAKRDNDNIHDDYLENLIKIRGANFFNEYVFICFNQPTWIYDENFQIEKFAEWMRANIPEHIPLTLAWVVKNY